MAEEPRTTRKSAGSPSALGLLDRVFDTVESFTGRLAELFSDTAETLITRAVQRLLGLLLLGVGSVFILVGAAQALDQLFVFPGVGAMLVGATILFVTALMLLVTQRR